MPKHVVEVLVIAALVLAIICTVTPSLNIVASEVSGEGYGVELAVDTAANIDEVSAQRIAKHR
jgi:hypothetical protein